MIAAVREQYDALFRDVLCAWRSVVRAKGFAVAASLTIALGVGANIALFSVVDRLLFRPLPFPGADRLVQIHLFATRIDDTVSAAMLEYEITEALRQHASSLEGLAVDGGWLNSTVPVPGENPLLLRPVSANLLDVLGVRPVIGRAFETADQNPGGEIAVLLTHDAWQKRFGGSPEILSRSWGTGRRRHRVVGVLPPGFFLPSSYFVERTDGLSVLDPTIVAKRLTIAPVARLRQRVSVRAAQAEVDLIARRQEWANEGLRRLAAAGRLKLFVQPLRDGLSMIVGPYLWLTSWAVWLVLAVASLNLSVLLLMQGVRRQQASAVSAALGASPWRLARIRWIEAWTLCLAGGALAWIASVWVNDWIVAMLPPTLRGLTVGPSDRRILGITLGVATLAAAVASAVPSLALRRPDLVALLGTASPTRRRGRVAGTGLLLCAQSALAALVATGAVVVVPDFMRLLLDPTGFRDRDLFTVTVNHDWRDATEAARVEHVEGERHRVILEVIRDLPHVQRAAAAQPPPFVDGPINSTFWRARGVAGRELAVGPGLFQTLGAPIRAGRELTPGESAAPLAMVNEAGMRLLWPDLPTTAVPGRTIQTAGGIRTIIGVIGDIRSRPASPVTPVLFLPILSPEIEPIQSGLPVVLRMAPDTIPDVALLTTRLNERFPRNQARVISVVEQLAPFRDRPRFMALLFGTGALLVLSLVAVGVFAVANVECERRRRDMAIRMAVGASRGHARRLIFGQVLGPVWLGGTIGLGLAYVTIRSLQTAVRELTTVSPSPYLVGLLLVIIAAAAAVSRTTLRIRHEDVSAVLRSP